MAQKNFLKKHLQTLVTELGKIQTNICNTDNITAKELISQQKKYLEIQETLKWVGWLDREINSEADAKAIKSNGKPGSNNRIITLGNA